MAALSITPSLVIVTDGYRTGLGVSGNAISAGQPVYEYTRNVIKVADYSTEAAAAVVGVAINTAQGTGQPIRFIIKGAISLDASMAVGTVYCLGEDGEILPDADLIGSGKYKSVIGVATTENVLTVDVRPSGAVVPT